MGKWRYPFRLQLTFFGLQPSDRPHIFNEINEIILHGKGGYDWNTLYNMPVFHKRFIYQRIAEYYKKQQTPSAEETFNKKEPEVFRPNISTGDNKPYSTKISKK